MMKKIISNTINYLSIISFVIIFKFIFGDSNTLVGVTVVIAILVLKYENLMNKPIKNLLLLIATNVILGLFAYIADVNIWWGIAINFITVAGIGYFLSYNLNKAFIVPFGLQYLFMLYTPVSGIDFTKRIAALVFGAILIMLVQVIVQRKDKVEKHKDTEENSIVEFEEVEDLYRRVNVFGREIKFHYDRAKFAIRIGLITAITACLVGHFKLEQGRWLVYTVFSITELHVEHCKIKSKQRLQGTVIGVLIVFVLFIFIKEDILRFLIVLIAGYLDGYTTNYRDKIICVTISVVVSTSLTSSTIITAVERVSYVTIGVLIALLVNKYFLKTELENKKIA